MKTHGSAVLNRGGYFTVEYNQPQVLILPIVENNSVVMVRVRRPVIADNTLELPAGGVQMDESPIEAACRELSEETGIKIHDLSLLSQRLRKSKKTYPKYLILHGAFFCRN